MDGSEITFVFPYLAAGLISAGVGWWVLRRRNLAGAGSFALLALAEAAWTFCYILQNFAPDLPAKLFWNNLQFSATLTSALGYLGFALNYTDRRQNYPRLLWRTLALGALALMALFWTDGTHHLLRTDLHLAPGAPFLRLVFQNGPLYFLFTLYTYGLIAYSTVLLAANFFSSPRIYRLQVGTVLLGIFIPWGTSLLSYSGLIPVPLHDITPLTFAPSNLLMAWAVFRYRLFDVAPIARDILVERMRDGVMVLDQRLRIVDFNPAACEILGLSNTDSPGRYIARELPTLYQFVAHLIETPNARSEISLEVLGMSSRYEVSATPLYDRLGQLSGYLVILRDITEQKRAEEKLKLLAQTDYLTGVLNRRAFFEQASAELERSRRYQHPLAFILFDVDNFKKVNDTYGHLVGDHVLQNLARTCRHSLREVDKLARYGGEEFVVMLPETGLTGALQSAERLRELIEGASIATYQGRVKVSASMGVTVFQPERGYATLDRLLGQADQAMFHAKQAGRNQVCAWQDVGQMSEV